MNLWPPSHVRSRDKRKTKFLLLHSAWDYETWQDGDLWWREPFDHVVTWAHVTNWKLNISPSARSVTTKQDRLGTYGERNPRHMILWQRGDLRSHGRLKRNMSSLARLVAMKLGKLVTYGEVNAPMKSHVPLTT